MVSALITGISSVLVYGWQVHIIETNAFVITGNLWLMGNMNIHECTNYQISYCNMVKSYVCGNNLIVLSYHHQALGEITNFLTLIGV